MKQRECGDTATRVVQFVRTPQLAGRVIGLLTVSESESDGGCMGLVEGECGVDEGAEGGEWRG